MIVNELSATAHTKFTPRQQAASEEGPCPEPPAGGRVATGALRFRATVALKTIAYFAE